MRNKEYKNEQLYFFYKRHKKKIRMLYYKLKLKLIKKRIEREWK